MFQLIKLSFVFVLLSFWSKKTSATLTVTDVTYLDVSIGNVACGRIVIGLFGRIVPKTCKNFCCLCSKEYGFGYQGSIFHRCIKNFMIQGGDYELGNGMGGNSIFKDGSGKFGKFGDESFYIKHYGAGWLSMANSGPNTNGAQFFITLRNCAFLDNKHVVFGKVLEGMSTVRQIENVRTNENNEPLYPVRIHQCGRMVCNNPFEVKEKPVGDDV